MKTLRRKEKYRDNWDNRRATASVIATACAATIPGGLRADLTLLDDDQRGDLIRLSLTAAEGPGFSLSRLASKRERARWEELTERAAGKEPGSVFDRARGDAAFVREMRALGRKARTPARRVDLHEAGSITLKKAWCFDWFERPDPVLFISHLGLLCFLAAQFENGEATVRGGSMEGVGDELALLIDTRIGLGAKFDDDESLLRWRDSLEHLVRNKFFELEKKGPILRLTLGTRLRKTERVAA